MTLKRLKGDKKMKIKLGTKIDYFGNVYEYIGDEKGYMYFQSVNDDTHIKFHCTNFYSRDVEIIE